jgi:MFS transporter, ACS family, tartrate transporter
MEQDQAAQSAIAKAARRLLPFLCLCYAVNFLDRVNVGFAALALNQDRLHAVNLWRGRRHLLHRLSLVRDPEQSRASAFRRAHLDRAHLTYWFPARERARIVSLFMAAVPLATLVGGPASGVLLELHGLGGLKGWHWLFIVEGLPAVLLGLAALNLLPDRPSDAPWLSDDEKYALEAKLAAEAKTTRDVGYHALGDALTRPRMLVLALRYFCIVVGPYGIGFWMPQVIQTFGLAPLEIGFLTAVPYLFASIGMVSWGWHSDLTGERIWHVALPLFLARAAFAWSATGAPLAVTMLALTLATVGIYAAVSTFWSLPTAILTGTGAAAGLALVNSVGNLGGSPGRRSSA